MTRVLLADDHAAVRTGFAMILRASGIDVVGEASTGLEVLELAASLTPEVILMDVQMPGLDGIEATRRILATTGRDEPIPYVVIVTTFDRDDYLFAALDAGASGFLLKTAGPEELVHAVRVAASGDALLAPAVTRRVITRYARDNDQAPQAKTATVTPVDLTEREREVLHLVAEAMSNTEIAQTLVIGEATVKTHVSNVLLKLGARDRVAAAVWAHRHGMG